MTEPLELAVYFCWKWRVDIEVIVSKDQPMIFGSNLLSARLATDLWVVNQRKRAYKRNQAIGSPYQEIQLLYCWVDDRCLIGRSPTVVRRLLSFSDVYCFFFGNFFTIKRKLLSLLCYARFLPQFDHLKDHRRTIYKKKLEVFISCPSQIGIPQFQSQFCSSVTFL